MAKKLTACHLHCMANPEKVSLPLDHKSLHAANLSVQLCRLL